jgi:hypothetical protein
MKWVWIVLGLCAVGVVATVLVTLLGCGEAEVSTAPVAQPREPVSIVHGDLSDLPVGSSIGPPYVGPRAMARVRRHPDQAKQVCSKACAAANGHFYQAGPAETRWGWECLCSWED